MTHLGSFHSCICSTFGIEFSKSFDDRFPDRVVRVSNHLQQQWNYSVVPRCDVDLAESFHGRTTEDGVGTLEIGFECRDVIIRKGEGGRKYASATG